MLPASFSTKISLLFAFVAAIIVYDFLRYRGRARRWKSYTFLLSTGALWSVLGALNDLITSEISPSYFAEGKQLGYGPDLGGKSVILGLQAGFTLGIGLSGLLLVFNHYPARIPGLALLSLSRLLLYPLALSAAFGLLLGSVYYLYGTGLNEDSPGFFTVWGIHTGLYVGSALGIGIAIVRLQRRRRSISESLGR